MWFLQKFVVNEIGSLRHLKTIKTRKRFNNRMFAITRDPVWWTKGQQDISKPQKNCIFLCNHQITYFYLVDDCHISKITGTDTESIPFRLTSLHLSPHPGSSQQHTNNNNNNKREDRRRRTAHFSNRIWLRCWTKTNWTWIVRIGMNEASNRIYIRNRRKIQGERERETWRKYERGGWCDNILIKI